MSKYQYIIEKKINFEVNYDVVKRSISSNTVIYYLSSLVDSYIVNDLIKGFMIKRNTYLNGSVIKETNLDNIVTSIFSGCLLLIDNDSYYIIETRNYPTRSISESESEKSLKGSHDSFNESILTNTGLIRRRIKDEKFKCELFTIGNNSKTDVSINYIDGKVDKRLLIKIKRKLKNINVDSLDLADKSLAELMFNQKFQIFPKVRFSERPDVASIHILKGYIVILVDTSSSAIIVPTTFFELNEQLNEYQLPPIISTFDRLFRLFCILIAMYLLPLWFILCIDGTFESSTFLIINNVDKKILFIQIISVYIFLSIIRLASLNISSMLSTSMSLVASIILSSLAIETGLIYPEVIFYCSLVTLASYSISNYETSKAISLTSLLLIISIGLFNKIGFIITNTIIFINLINIESFNVFYLYPFIPFNFKDLINRIIKVPLKNKN